MAGKQVYEHRFRVPYAHVDQMGFVYYANYLVYFEMARAHFLRDSGLPYPELERQGVMLPVVEAHCDYRKPANYDDLVAVRTRCIAWTGARLRIEYEVVREEHGTGEAAGSVMPQPLATGYTVHVCMSPDGRVLRPPPELKALVDGNARPASP